MFATMTGGGRGESAGDQAGSQTKTWHVCLAEGLNQEVLRATEGSTAVHTPSAFVVETAVWTVATSKAGTWYRGVLEAAERFTWSSGKIMRWS